MTKDYQSKEFPLVRVILPKQELKPDGATIFFKDRRFYRKINLERYQKYKEKQCLGISEN